MIVVGLILFNYDFSGFGVLNRRFVPRSYLIVEVGVLRTAAGIGFAIWARNHIGRFLSASVAIREDHQLIRTGPYARIRDPIYTGILAALAGTALALGNFRGLAAFIFIALSYKARKEEPLLAREFGSAFEDHHRRTGFFLPRLT